MFSVIMTLAVMSNVSQRDDDVHNPENHDHGLRCVFQSDNIEEKLAYCNMIRNTEVFSSENFQYIKRLYEIFWHEMAQVLRSRIWQLTGLACFRVMNLLYFGT